MWLSQSQKEGFKEGVMEDLRDLPTLPWPDMVMGPHRRNQG